MFNHRVKSANVEAFIFSDAAKFPDWLSDCIADGIVEYEFGMVVIIHNDASTTVNKGDYIIKMKDGTVFSCPKHIFELLYEKDK